MSKKDQIPRVNTGARKNDTYKKLFDRYTKAVKSEFYLETIVLEYAMIEDRFTEILRTLGLITLNKNESQYIPVDGLATDLFRLVNPNKKEIKQHGSFGSISSKIKVIKALAKEKRECPEALQLQRECVLAANETAGVKKDGTRSMAILLLIRKIEEWNTIRNQYIHALYNKDFEQAMAMLPETSKQGIVLAREIDSFSNRVETQAKKRNIHRT